MTGWSDEAAGTPNLFSLEGARNEFHTFPDYLGVSSEVSYVVVTWLETFGCISIMLGLATRLQALGLFVVMMVAWIFHHHMGFRAPHGGETAFLFAWGFAVLVCAGAGRYSLDRKLGLQG